MVHLGLVPWPVAVIFLYQMENLEYVVSFCWGIPRYNVYESWFRWVRCSTAEIVTPITLHNGAGIATKLHQYMALFVGDKVVQLRTTSDTVYEMFMMINTL